MAYANGDQIKTHAFITEIENSKYVDFSLAYLWQSPLAELFLGKEESFLPPAEVVSIPKRKIVSSFGGQ